MSARSKSLLERWLEAGDAGDVEAFDEYLPDDVIVHAPLGLSTTGTSRRRTSGMPRSRPSRTSATRCRR
jgi:hypothetical protein